MTRVTADFLSKGSATAPSTGPEKRVTGAPVYVDYKKAGATADPLAHRAIAKFGGAAPSCIPTATAPAPSQGAPQTPMPLVPPRTYAILAAVIVAAVCVALTTKICRAKASAA